MLWTLVLAAYAAVVALAFDRVGLRFDRDTRPWWAAKAGVFVAGLAAVVLAVEVVGPYAVLATRTYR